MSRRAFFDPIPVTFRRPKPGVLSDNDLLRAWGHIGTDRLRQMIGNDNGKEPRVLETRRRVLALRLPPLAKEETHD